MKLKGNTILITGGSSGLGLEMAKQFLALDNTVIICGRSLEKLEKAKAAFPAVHIISCDISSTKACEELVAWIKRGHPNCNVLVNNAAIVNRGSFIDESTSVKAIQSEISTNLIAPIVLAKLFLPTLEKNQQPTIVNIGSGLAYVPKKGYPFYNATKAGLHSFTQTLRLQLDTTKFSVVEVQFPVVDTPWHQGNVPKMAILPREAVKKMLTSLENGDIEIKVGKVKLLYWLARIAPKFALKKLNGIN